MKLWLDDIRPAPEGWALAQTAEEAIAILATGEVTVASLDHDIRWADYGTDEDWENRRTGYAVVVWMEEHNVWPRDGVYVHSMNPVGSERMKQVIAKHYGTSFPA